MEIVFNIETAGLPKDEILHLMPEFSAPSNYKDAEKIQAYQGEKAGGMALGRFGFGFVRKGSCNSPARALQRRCILCRQYGRNASSSKVLGFLPKPLRLPFCRLRVQWVRHSVSRKAFMAKPRHSAQYIPRKIPERKFRRPFAGLGLRNVGTRNACQFGKVFRVKIRSSSNSV